MEGRVSETKGGDLLYAKASNIADVTLCKALIHFY